MAYPLTSGGAKHFVTRRLGMTTLGLTAGAEASNAIPITVQLEDVAGNSIASADTWIAEVVGELTSAYTLAETGAGTEVSNTAKNQLAFTLSANGAATISIADVSTTSTDTLTVAFRPADSLGVPAYVTVTFA